MNSKSLHIILYIIIIVYIISIAFYGVKNISVYNIILFLFASPLVEEYIFRGLVQKNIQKYIKYTFFSYITLSNIITSIIFTACHFVADSNFIVTTLIFIPSIYLGILYDQYKSIKQPFFAHSILNIIVFINYPVDLFPSIMKIILIQ